MRLQRNEAISMVHHGSVGREFTFEVVPFIGISELESGRYRLVTHSKYFELKPDKVEDAKKEWARSIEEQGKGSVKVESVTFKSARAGKVESGWIARSGAEVVEEDHTVIETVFTVKSPFPFALLLVAVIVAMLCITAWVFAGEIKKIVDVLYKAIAPIAPAFGILLLVVLALWAVPKVIPKRKEGG